MDVITDSTSSTQRDELSFSRRKLIIVSGTVGGGILAGAYIFSEELDDEEPVRQLPPDLEELHISSGEEHLIAADSDESYHLIRWEEQGMLRIESGGSLTMKDINNA